MFGGVYDDEEDDEELKGTFFNDLVALDVERHQWRSVNLSGKRDASGKRRRRKDGSEEEEEEKESEKIMEVVDPTPAVTTMDDGIFTVTVGPAPVASNYSGGDGKTEIFTPSPRINPGLVVKNNVLYLYGGMFEKEERQYTLNDFYSLGRIMVVDILITDGFGIDFSIHD